MLSFKIKFAFDMTESTLQMGVNQINWYSQQVILIYETQGWLSHKEILKYP